MSGDYEELGTIPEDRGGEMGTRLLRDTGRSTTTRLSPSSDKVRFPKGGDVIV